jgi:predicted ATPase
VRNLPAQISPLVGRADDRRALRAELLEHRLLAIVGQGGAGKISLALALASELTAGQRDGVCYLDLAPLEAPRFIAPALAATVGLEPKPEKSSGLGAALKPMQMLLVLDNCEHVVEAAATLVAEILNLTEGTNSCNQPRAAARPGRAGSPHNPRSHTLPRRRS